MVEPTTEQSAATTTTTTSAARSLSACASASIPQGSGNSKDGGNNDKNMINNSDNGKNDAQHRQEEEQPREEWEIQRDQHKSAGDESFRSRDYRSAIRHYTNALSFDPENHVLLSNRSAAYLSNGEKSRALADARGCIEVSPPAFVKGHTRLGAAMMSLGRYSEARDVYANVLKIRPDNDVAKKGVEDCRAKEREAHAREVERVKMEMERGRKTNTTEEKSGTKADEKTHETNYIGHGSNTEKDDLLDDFFSQVENSSTTKTGKTKIKGEEQQSASAKPRNDKDDLLDDFFLEMENVTKNNNKQEPETPHDDEPSSANSSSSGNEGDGVKNEIQIQLSDLGTSKEQIARLLCTNHEWKNLNPFYVLDVPHNAPGDMISRRYKALSLLVHPDKCSHARAKDAFEEVRKAMNLLNDEDKARHARAIVDRGMKQGKRDYEAQQHQKGGLVSKADAKAGLIKAQEVAVMKIFAEIEMARRDVERRKRNQEKREREQEDEEVRKAKKEREFEKKWREENRVEKRIGNWRDFQKDGGSKKKKSRWT